MGSGAFIETKKDGEKCDHTHLFNVLFTEVRRQGLGWTMLQLLEKRI